MRRETAILQAKSLYDKDTHPEYLRGMCELIAYTFQSAEVMPSDDVEHIEKQITG